MLHNPLKGIGLMLLSGLFLTTNDGISKWFVPHYPTAQILFGASINVVLIIVLYQVFIRRKRFAIRDYRLHCLRGALFTIASFAFVAALKYLPLATVVCIAFAGPLFMTLMGKLFLGETVGRYRLASVCVGFVGVVFMVNPTVSPLHWSVLLPLVVAVCDAARDVTTRKMTVSEDSVTIVMTTSLVVCAVSLLTAGDHWSWPDTQHLLLFVGAGFFMVVAYFLMVEAYRHAPTVVLAPFRYVQIIWSILAGIVVWNEYPQWWIYIGLCLTAGSGIFIAYREYVTRNTHGNADTGA
ncbi:MAG: DMT family transporter [Pseudomonadota bacterium]